MQKILPMSNPPDGLGPGFVGTCLTVILFVISQGTKDVLSVVALIMTIMAGLSTVLVNYKKYKKEK